MSRKWPSDYRDFLLDLVRFNLVIKATHSKTIIHQKIAPLTMNIHSSQGKDYKQLYCSYIYTNTIEIYITVLTFGLFSGRCCHLK